MEFGANKTPLKVIREDAFGGTYFRDIYSGINGKWYKKSQKEFGQLKSVDQKYYCSDYYDINFNKYDVKCATSLRFCENKGWINEIYLDGWFQWCFGTGLVEDQKMMKDKLIDGKKLRVGLGVNQSRLLKTLVVNLKIIQFQLELDRFHCIGAMN